MKLLQLVMVEYYAFCDGSFHPPSKTGVAAILILSGEEWERSADRTVFPIETRVISADSITQIELKAALWALSDPRLGRGTRLITDCKTIENLPGRQVKLEAKGYLSGQTGLPLAHADLYRAFFKVYEALAPQITWVKGHSPRARKSKMERVFGLVDQEARRVLRRCRMPHSAPGAVRRQLFAPRE